ncbi:hypothetical protein SNEBB_006908 [Seison nebaliae]|nr:hypothetical protein SNEBB_006908 [Seison nebaliae]
MEYEAVTKEDLNIFVRSVLAELPRTAPKDNCVSIRPNDKKQDIRNRLWNLMTDQPAEYNPTRKYLVDNYPESWILTAENVRKLPNFSNIRNIRVDPEYAYRYLRTTLQKEKKNVFIPLSQRQDSILYQIPNKLISGKLGTPRDAIAVRTENYPVLDLIIFATVGVDLYGNLVGKGGRFNDLELMVLMELNLVRNDTIIAVLVDEIQIIKGELPKNLRHKYDMVVDYIITPKRLIKTDVKYERTKKLVWKDINEDRMKYLFNLRKLRLQHFFEGRDVRLAGEKNHPTINYLQTAVHH